ncbi:hypothetical protein H7169_02325 [Candidatus Gracilibacteria bacterium]|nr:hypothetical protein [Candidatus Gracilibacteria bacterium]
MDFRNKLKSYISRLTKGGKKQWKKEVQKEKKQKYLFGASDPDDIFKRSRNTSKLYYQKERITAFSSFFQEKIITGDIFKTYGYIMSMIGLMLILLTVYIIAFSPYFKISPNQVMVEAMTPGVDIGIAYRALEGIYGQSIFLLDEADIASKLKLHLKNLEAVSIDRYYPNGIKVLITGAPILFDTTITGIPDKKWGLSKNGVLIPEKDLGETVIKYHLEITAENLIGDLFLNYKQGIDEYNMTTISRVFEIFTSEWSNIKLTKSRYFLGENELHIILDSGTRLIFALQDDSEKRPGTISKNILDELVTLRTYIASNRSRITDGSLSYIDARIPGKLFVCVDKVICQKNLILIYGEVYR